MTKYEELCRVIAAQQAKKKDGDPAVMVGEQLKDRALHRADFA